MQLTVPEADDVIQDREHESRFGATPVPGKIGMAMAGQGLHAQPPPRPPSHNFFGHTSHQNPGNQLYVGNVRVENMVMVVIVFITFPSCRTKLDGKTSKIYSGLPGTLSALISILVQTAAPRDRAQLFLKPQRMPNKQSVSFHPANSNSPLCVVALTQFLPAMYSGFDWYGRILEVREVRSFTVQSIP